MKEHIESLESLAHWLRSDSSSTAQTAVKALTAAIELMRAAKPLDEAAEMEHCLDVISRSDHGSLDLTKLMRECAQARAEGYAKAEVECASCHEASDICRENYDKVADQLSAAQAEIDCLSTDNDVLRFEVEKDSARLVATSARLSAAQALNDQCARDFAAKLSAAQAEIEEATHFGGYKVNVELQTKLAAAQAEIEALVANLADADETRRSLQTEIETLTSDLQHRYEDTQLLRSQLRTQAALHAHWNDVSDKLSAAQAEIERLKQERDVMAFERDTHLEANQERIATLHTNGVQSLNKQVTELQAEIEQAGRDLREEIARCDTLETKLQNLRTAAERAKRELEHSHSHGSHKAIPMLAAAIEASR